MISPKLRNERLRKLAAYLITLPKERVFDMRSWGHHHSKHKPTQKNMCGTSACVLGHAAMIPEFKRLGLKLEWEKQFLSDPNTGYENTSKPIGYTADVYFNGHEGPSAGEQFFGLTPVEANKLFLENMGATAIDKAREILALIQE